MAQQALAKLDGQSAACMPSNSADVRPSLWVGLKLLAYETLSTRSLRPQHAAGRLRLLVYAALRSPRELACWGSRQLRAV